MKAVKQNNNWKFLFIIVAFAIGCEDMYEPDVDYVDCEWIQYAQEQIYDCEDVSWCDETIYSGEKVRKAWIYYLNDKPDIDNSLFTGGVNRIFYWSYQSDCVKYSDSENEIGCNVIDYGYVTANTSGHLISFKENN